MRLEPLEGTQRTRLGLVFGGVLLLGGASAWVWFALGLPLPGCVFRALTGQPCVTCGSTRLARALLDGHVGAAFLHNPLVFLAGVAVGAWAGLDLAGFGIRVERTDWWPIRIAALVLVAANWAWLIASGQ